MSGFIELHTTRRRPSINPSESVGDIIPFILSVAAIDAVTDFRHPDAAGPGAALRSRLWLRRHVYDPGLNGYAAYIEVIESRSEIFALLRGVRVG